MDEVRQQFRPLRCHPRRYLVIWYFSFPLSPFAFRPFCERRKSNSVISFLFSFSLSFCFSFFIFFHIKFLEILPIDLLTCLCIFSISLYSIGIGFRGEGYVALVDRRRIHGPLISRMCRKDAPLHDISLWGSRATQHGPCVLARRPILYSLFPLAVSPFPFRRHSRETMPILAMVHLHPLLVEHICIPLLLIYLMQQELKAPPTG